MPSIEFTGYLYPKIYESFVHVAHQKSSNASAVSSISIVLIATSHYTADWRLLVSFTLMHFTFGESGKKKNSQFSSCRTRTSLTLISKRLCLIYMQRIKINAHLFLCLFSHMVDLLRLGVLFVIKHQMKLKKALWRQR